VDEDFVDFPGTVVPPTGVFTPRTGDVSYPASYGNLTLEAYLTDTGEASAPFLLTVSVLSTPNTALLTSAGTPLQTPSLANSSLDLQIEDLDALVGEPAEAYQILLNTSAGDGCFVAPVSLSLLPRTVVHSASLSSCLPEQFFTGPLSEVNRVLAAVVYDGDDTNTTTVSVTLWEGLGSPRRYDLIIAYGSAAPTTSPTPFPTPAPIPVPTPFPTPRKIAGYTPAGFIYVTVLLSLVLVLLCGVCVYAKGNETTMYLKRGGSVTRN